MKKLKAVYSSVYRSKAGNTTFVYNVSGTPENLEAYKLAQGDYFRVDDVTGKVLYFTTSWNGEKLDLIITTNGKVITDTSATDKLVAVVNRSSGILQDKLAGLVASHILGGLLGTAAPAQVAAPATMEAPIPADNVDAAF